MAGAVGACSGAGRAAARHDLNLSGRHMIDCIEGLTTLVVVAADSGPLLAKAVDSALASDVPVEIVLVDNASTDGEVELVAERHCGDARLRILKNDANLGFGPACNRGAAIAQGDVLVFLNPDCELRTDSVRGLREVLDSHDRIGLLGVMVCDPDGLPARGNRRRDPSLRRALMTLSGLSRLESRWAAFAGIEMPPASGSPEIEPVEAVSGACMAMPRGAFDGVAGFDEGYFLHVEDLDLCRRVRGAGWKVSIAHTVRVTHTQGSSSYSRPLFVSRHKHRSMWRYFVKFDPAARSWILRCLVAVGISTHYLMQASKYLVSERLRRSR